MQFSALAIPIPLLSIALAAATPKQVNRPSRRAPVSAKYDIINCDGIQSGCQPYSEEGPSATCLYEELPDSDNQCLQITIDGSNLSVAKALPSISVAAGSTYKYDVVNCDEIPEDCELFTDAGSDVECKYAELPDSDDKCIQATKVEDESALSESIQEPRLSPLSREVPGARKQTMSCDDVSEDCVLLTSATDNDECVYLPVSRDRDQCTVFRVPADRKT